MRQILLFSSLILFLFGCKDTPTSEEVNLNIDRDNVQIDGYIFNEMKRYAFESAINNVNVKLINSGDTLEVKTDEFGYFKFEKIPVSSEDTLSINLSRVAYRDTNYTVNMANHNQNELKIRLAKIKMKTDNQSRYIYSEIYRDIKKDYVLLELYSDSEQCKAEPNDLFLKDSINVGTRSRFSFSIPIGCEDVQITAESENHHSQTKNSDVRYAHDNRESSINNFVLISNERTFYEAEVKVDFYYLINGKKFRDIHGYLDFTQDGSSAFVRSVKDGSISFDVRFENGKDEISLIAYYNPNALNHPQFSLPRTNFNLQDFEIIDGIIYLGELEVPTYKANYVIGNLIDPNNDFNGIENIYLKADYMPLSWDNPGVSINVDEDGYFHYLTGTEFSNSTEFSLKIPAEYNIDTDTILYTGLLESEPIAPEIINYYIKDFLLNESTIYRLDSQIDFISTNGDIKPEQEVNIAVNGLHTYLPNSTNQFDINQLFGEKNQLSSVQYRINSTQVLNNYSISKGHLYKKDFNNNSYILSTNLYEIGKPTQYVNNLSVGNTWVYNIKTTQVDLSLGEDAGYDGQLIWEITEQINDSTYELKQIFDGDFYHYCCGSYSYSPNYFSTIYQLTITRNSLKFTLIDERNDRIFLIPFFLKNSIENFLGQTYNEEIIFIQEPDFDNCFDYDRNQNKHEYSFKEGIGLSGLSGYCIDENDYLRKVNLTLIETNF